jgi:hypothetical protein
LVVETDDGAGLVPDRHETPMMIAFLQCPVSIALEHDKIVLSVNCLASKRLVEVWSQVVPNDRPNLSTRTTELLATFQQGRV